MGSIRLISRSSAMEGRLRRSVEVAVTAWEASACDAPEGSSGLSTGAVRSCVCGDVSRITTWPEARLGCASSAEVLDRVGCSPAPSRDAMGSFSADLALLGEQGGRGGRSGGAGGRSNQRIAPTGWVGRSGRTLRWADQARCPPSLTSTFAVRPLGFEPRTCGLRVRCSAIELEALVRREKLARLPPLWGDRGDLNPRPPGPQPGALTELSYGHHVDDLA